MNALALACSSARRLLVPLLCLPSALISAVSQAASCTLYISQHTLARNLVVRGVTTDTASIPAGSSKTYGFTTP